MFKTHAGIKSTSHINKTQEKAHSLNNTGEGGTPSASSSLYKKLSEGKEAGKASDETFQYSTNKFIDNRTITPEAKMRHD